MEENKGGRPPKLTKPLGRKICQLLCEGSTLRQIEEHPEIIELGGASKSTILRWQYEEGTIYEWFQDQYARALDIRSALWDEECIEIADDGTNDYYLREGKDGEQYWAVDHEHIQRSRVRIDTRKWAAAHQRAKKGIGADVKETQIIFVRGETRKSAKENKDPHKITGTE